MKKQHDITEYWTYRKIGRLVVPHYVIDGENRGTEHGAAQYLMDNYNMNFSEAYKYVHEIIVHGN